MHASHVFRFLSPFYPRTIDNYWGQEYTRTLIPKKFLKTLGTISLNSNTLDNIYFQNKQIDRLTLRAIKSGKKRKKVNGETLIARSVFFLFFFFYI